MASRSARRKSAAPSSAYGWPEDAQFLVPDGVLRAFRRAARRARREAAAREWRRDVRALPRPNTRTSPHELDDDATATSCPRAGTRDIPSFPADAKGIATRDAAQKVLNAIAPHVPWLIGGAADLAPSTKTNLTFDGAGSFEAGQLRRPQHAFRHPRARHGRDRATAWRSPALRAYGGRLPDLQRLHAAADPAVGASWSCRSIYIFTHDSIGVGEDGPTHQPIEQLAALRAIPGLHRAAARRRQRGGRGLARVVAQLKDQPACLVLVAPGAADARPRRNTPPPPASRAAPTCWRDAPSGTPEVILMATGSEVSLCRRGADAPAADGDRAPGSSACRAGSCSRRSRRRLSRQRAAAAAHRARVAVEAAARSAGTAMSAPTGAIIGMHSFGASAPGSARVRAFRFTAERVADVSRQAVHERTDVDGAMSTDTSTTSTRSRTTRGVAASRLARFHQPQLHRRRRLAEAGRDDG